MQFSKDLQIIIFKHQNKNKLNILNLKIKVLFRISDIVEVFVI